VLPALERTLSEKYAANFRKMQLLRRTWLKGKYTERKLVLVQPKLEHLYRREFRYMVAGEGNFSKTSS